MVGNFHLVKAGENCFRKLLKGTRFQDPLVQTKVSSVKSAEAVMSGSHYVRSLCEVLMIPDMINDIKTTSFRLYI